jgi:hypothetical protein
MKANELRIGNLMNFPFTNEIIEVVGINAHESIDLQLNKTIINTISFRKDLNLYCEPIDKIEPILLNEEWHNNFGIIKNGFHYFEYKIKRKNNYNIEIIFTGDYIMLIQRDGKIEDDLICIWNKDITKRDMYVHEFQNLYFALTGEELTLKS